MKRKDIQNFFEKHGLLHAERVEFTLNGYTIWSYRRDEKGDYVVVNGLPVIETKFVAYEDADNSPW